MTANYGLTDLLDVRRLRSDDDGPERTRGQITMRAKSKRRMTRKQAESLKKRLLRRRSRLLRGLRSQLESLRRGGERRASDTGDNATSALQEFESLHVAEMEVQELKKIDGAVRRIDAGTFDVCEECGGRIGRERLRALPHATLCVDCQAQLEREGRGQVSEERWTEVVDAEADLDRAVGVPDERLDGVERRY